MRIATVLCSLVIASFARVAPSNAEGGWPTDPLTRLVVCNAPGAQTSPALLEDGRRGAFVVWGDRRDGPADLYGQHFLANGRIDPRWTPNGKPLVTLPGAQYQPLLVHDGGRGLLVIFGDSRYGDADLFATHLLADGSRDPVWPDTCVKVCSAIGQQQHWKATSDGRGGAFVVWDDYRASVPIDSETTRFRSQIRLQHLLADGRRDPLWPSDGLRCTSSDSMQIGPRLERDGSTGVYVTWGEFRFDPNDQVLFAQHVQADGTLAPGWPSEGARLDPGDDQQSFNQGMVPAGGDGVIVVWTAGVTGDFGFRQTVHARRLVSGGFDPAWPTDPVDLSRGGLFRTLGGSASDGAGGAFVSLQSSQSADVFDVRVTHVLATGEADPRWPGEGLTCAPLTNSHLQWDPRIISDGNGGALVVWDDLKYGGTWELVVQHLLGEGLVDGEWQESGRSLGIVTGLDSLSFPRPFPLMVTDGDGGAVISWMDITAETGADIEAKRIERFGWLGDPAPELAGVADSGPDQGGFAQLQWLPSVLETQPAAGVTTYRIERMLTSNPSHARDAGLPTWVALDSVVAGRSPQYSLVVSTSHDSSSADSSADLFRIVAVGAHGAWWATDATAVHSLDNLAPAAPSQLTATHVSGAAHLRWNANTEPDLAGYVIYRSTTPEAAIGPSQRIATLTQAQFDDVADTLQYYAVVARDIHDNESPGTWLKPRVLDGGAPPPPLPSVVALAPPVPNPARFVAELTADLPAAANVRLEVFDTHGRHVRGLFSGSHAAGQMHVAWDLRDDAGRIVPAGLYLIRYQSGGTTRTRRLTVLD